MPRSVMIALFWLIAALPSPAQEREKERLEECGNVLEEILGMPDNIPQEPIDKAECVVVFPSVKKSAIGFGGSYGRGAVVCRAGEDCTGPETLASSSKACLTAGECGANFRHCSRVSLAFSRSPSLR